MLLGRALSLFLSFFVFNTCFTGGAGTSLSLSSLLSVASAVDLLSLLDSFFRFLVGGPFSDLASCLCVRYVCVCVCVCV